MMIPESETILKQNIVVQFLLYLPLQIASILKKAEENKRKAAESQGPTGKKDKNTKVESSSGASDKSLRLLEKELQELKRVSLSLMYSYILNKYFLSGCKNNIKCICNTT